MGLDSADSDTDFQHFALRKSMTKNSVYDNDVR
jgi:hypothetical protein